MIMLRNLSKRVQHASKSVQRGLKVAYSPSGVSHDIAKAIIEAPNDQHEAILERFVKMKKHELATVLLSVS